MNKVERAFKRVDTAKDQLHAAIAEYFVPGKYVCYWSSGWIDCRVVSVSDDRVRVTGTMSGKTYWVYAYRFFRGSSS